MLFEQTNTRLRRRPGLTPLIDVVFLLLIFFMLASSLETEALLPLVVRTDGDRASIRDASHTELRVEISSGGAARLAGRDLDLPDLTLAVEEALREARARVRVTPHAEAPLQAIASVLEALQRAGATDVALTATSPPGRAAVMLPEPE